MNRTLVNQLKKLVKPYGGLASVGSKGDRYVIMAKDKYCALMEERDLAQTKARIAICPFILVAVGVLRYNS